MSDTQTEPAVHSPREYLHGILQHAIHMSFNVDVSTSETHLEVPGNASHGDFACNIALKLAKTLKQPPREIAQAIVDAIEVEPDRLSSVDIAGPGFINFTLGPGWLTDILIEIEASDEKYGTSDFGIGKRIQVEFVSANPTGPLTLGHGRQAVIGDTLSRLFEWTGHEVTREYYFNNAGTQMALLGESVYARYMELLGNAYPFPENGYHGDYIRELAQDILDNHGSEKSGIHESGDLTFFKDAAEGLMFSAIKDTLFRLGITFDIYYNETTLYESGRIQKVIDSLRERGFAYEQDGATWFKATAFGQEQDRVIVRSSTGEPTYRLPDIAYHQHKFERGFDQIVDIFGADHHQTYQDVRAGIEALGCDMSRLTTVIHQFVTLMRDGEAVRMSKRAANFVTVDELLDEVGADVMRFFILMRGHNSHLNFDLDLAKEESDKNPVYYVQYAHARTANILKHAKEQGHTRISAESAQLALLDTPEEAGLIKILGEFPEVIKGAVQSYEPHRMTGYLREVASALHSFYFHHKVVRDDQPQALTQSRLALVNATRIVLRNGLSVIGVSAPEKM